MASQNLNNPQEQKSWFSKTVDWLLGKNEEEQEPETKYDLEAQVHIQNEHEKKSWKPEDSPLCSTNCSEPQPGGSPNISGMFFRLAEEGMDPGEARELLHQIEKARNEYRQRTTKEKESTEKRTGKGKRRVRFLDEISEEEEPVREGPAGGPSLPPVVGLGIDIGGNPLGEYDEDRIFDEDKDRGDLRFLNSFHSGTEKGPQGSYRNFGTASGNTPTPYGHQSIRAVATGTSDILSVPKAPASSFAIGDGDYDSEGDCKTTNNRKTPRSAYSQESRLMAERYVHGPGALKKPTAK